MNRSWEYEDTKFSDPESMKFDADDVIDAAVEVYLNPGNPLLQSEILVSSSLHWRRYDAALE
ncbi:MAG: hypothetical protein WA183_11035 [Chthoniobacterales bacterium]